MIVRFRIQNGAPSVVVGEPVTLDVLTVGQAPTEYRAAECGNAFDKAGFQRWPENGVPTFPEFRGIGVRTVCIQVRGSSSVTPVASDDVAVFPLLVQVAPVPHSADAGEAWAFGLPRGFGFEVQRESAAGACVLGIQPVESRNVLVLWAFSHPNPDFVPVTCRVDLFQGRNLEPGWRMVGVHTRTADTGVLHTSENPALEFECTGQGVDVDRVVDPSGTDDPHFAFTLTGDPDASGCLNFRLFIDTIDLEGPVLGDWRDAFGP